MPVDLNTHAPETLNKCETHRHKVHPETKARRKVLVALVLAAVHVYVLFTAYEPYFSDTCEWVERVRFQQLVFPAFVKDAARCDLTWWLDTGALVGAAHRHALLPWDKDIDVGMLVPLLKTGEEPWETVENRGRADFHPAYDCWFASDEVSSASYAGRIPGIRRQNSGWFSGSSRVDLAS